MLDSSAQIIEDQILASLRGEECTVMFDQYALSANSVEISHLIYQSCTVCSTSLISLTGHTLNEDSLFSVLNKLVYKSSELLTQSSSSYQAICLLLRKKECGALLISDAEALDGNSVQLLSRIVRFIRREGLDWTIFLIGDGSRVDQLSFGQLSIDLDVPHSLEYTQMGQLTKSPISSRRNRQRKQGKKNADHLHQTESKVWISVAAGLVSLLALNLVWVAFLSEETLPESPQVAASVAEHNVSNSLEIKPSSQASIIADQDDRYLSDREFMQRLSEIEQRREFVQFNDNVLSESRTKQNFRVWATQLGGVDERSLQEKPMSSDFYQALISSDTNKLSKLLVEGESLSARNSNGETALIYAVNANNSTLLNSLISMKARVNQLDTHGRGALFYACIQGNSVIVARLLRAGATVNVRSNLNKTPLMAATHNGHVKVAKLLIKHGAKVDLQDHSGWSALFYAAWNNDPELAQMLMQNNASSVIRDQDGYSAVQIARFRDSAKVMRLF